MPSDDDPTFVQRVNEEIRAFKELVRERFADEGESEPAALARVELLSEREEGQGFDEWWDENVSPLFDALEDLKEEVSASAFPRVRARLSVFADLIPDREDAREEN